MQKENFTLLTPDERRPEPKSLNPFQGLKPTQSLPEILRQMQSVFEGRSKEKRADGKVDPGKIGIFRYLLAEPVRFAFNLIKVPLFLLVAAGNFCVNGARNLFNLAGKMRFGRFLSSPLWLTLGVVGVALAVPALLGYAITYAVSQPINWLMQKAVVPALSRFVTYTIFFPVAGIDYLAAPLFSRPKESDEDDTHLVRNPSTRSTREKSNSTTNMNNSLKNPSQQQTLGNQKSSGNVPPSTSGNAISSVSSNASSTFAEKSGTPTTPTTPTTTDNAKTSSHSPSNRKI